MSGSPPWNLLWTIIIVIVALIIIVVLLKLVLAVIAIGPFAIEQDDTLGRITLLSSHL